MTRVKGRGNCGLLGVRRWEGASGGKRKAPVHSVHGRLSLEAGNGLLSHTVARIVPSALTGLTAVFGMGTGVAPSR